ncbi:hypothetical protein, variant 1 [Aphanomyces invadans]|uniref:tRNA nucleotidyltransferase/poly(A) polymerase RNA and SrmB- binding domain-containing protein n=1 Tax=Aphanomyces invadans TaxID=157072 RepID=A0A024UGU1_9STRA|nr:hypothetical protein, variant 1 [Aphanomyces invadans]ETW05494.1 hypothetical protein, variant 1 [Aphanomyces invadans]|eukprot:XP_008865271.1 hypothetical protein, variant 1 [Aphanomyces invadans]
MRTRQTTDTRPTLSGSSRQTQTSPSIWRLPRCSWAVGGSTLSTSARKRTRTTKPIAFRAWNLGRRSKMHSAGTLRSIVCSTTSPPRKSRTLLATYKKGIAFLAVITCLLQGLSDLRHGVIRTPLDPRITFLDDPLRVLRAIRFASRFQFPLAPDLVEALEQPNIREALVKKVSRERVGKELAGMLTGSHANPVVAIQCLHQFHLLDVVFQIPEGPFYSFQPAHTAASPTKVSIPSNWTDKAFASVQALHSLQLYRKDKVSDDTPSVETSSTTADGIEVATEGRANRAKLEMLAAVLLPLAEYSVLHKKKHVPVAHSIVRESIKFAAKEADHVSLVALNQCRRFVAIANAPFDRVQVGLLVREVGALWTVCADMAYLVEVVLEGVDVSSAREKYAALSTYVTRDAALDNVWEMKPLLNGKEVMEALALTPGPAVKAMNDAVIAYQLKFPSATRDDVLTHLVAL